MKNNHVGTPERFKPFRDRRVPIRSVVCPTCGVEVGQRCRRLDGTDLPATGPHRERRRRALREGL